MATTQAKYLKSLLKQLNIVDRDGKVPSVRTERIYAGTFDGRKLYEYGCAKAHTRALSDDEIKALKFATDSHILIYNNIELGFAVISY